MKEKQVSQEFQVSKGYAYYVFLLLFLLYLFNYIDRMVIASLFPYLKAEWGLTDTDCGWFASIVTLMMTVFVFPISLLIDRWSRKKAIAAMAVLWSFATIACALTRNFTQLFAMRAVVGTGEAAFTAGGHAMIAAYFPEEKRATMNGIFAAALPFGTAIGVILGGLIAVKLGWRYAFGLLAIPGLIVAILFFWVKDYKTVLITKNAGAGEVKMGWKDIAREFLHTPTVLYTYVGCVGNTFVTTALINWLPSYYNRIDGIPMDKAGIKTAVIFLLAVFGAPIGGIITDKLRKKWFHSRMSVPAFTSLLTSLALFTGFFFFEGTTQYIFLIIWGFTTPMFVAGATATTQDVVHPGLRAISYGLVQFFMMLLGYSLSPIFIGAISDRYDLLTAFKFLPLFSLLGAIGFLIGAFYYSRDYNKVQKVKLETSN